MRKIFIFVSFKKKRDGPRQGVAQGRVPSSTLIVLTELFYQAELNFWLGLYVPYVIKLNRESSSWMKVY